MRAAQVRVGTAGCVTIAASQERLPHCRTNMTNSPDPAQSIFLNALEIASDSERKAYLDNQCRGDHALRQDVEGLLQQAPRVGNFLESDAPANPAWDAVLQTTTGPEVRSIGPYRLREKIGEGGMGEVYVAEQIEPVRRKVALKIIKPGMATREVLARFEAERQALALMEHPHIARVFDGGATETGQPFFAMELVQGPPITQYCDDKRLSTNERLLLLLKVCRAVQHAHQKGIIHRDLKPSNILVAHIDDQAVPKVIDFGVAKAVSQKLTERTLYTQFSQMVGTPLYMSPEQAELGVVDVDTRSDVYSLGVLAYELLTGRTPIARETSQRMGPEELRRMIREQEASRPSAAVSTLEAQALSTVASLRSTEPRKLRDRLHGELDWLVMKTLEKDRSRRYESAGALAADIERFLNQQPIEAGPPSVTYRLRKFVQRNKRSLIGGASATLLLLAGMTVAVFAQQSHNRRQAEIVQQVRSSLATARAAIETGDLARARQWIGEGKGQLVHVAGAPDELIEQVDQLTAEIDSRRREVQRFQEFEQLARRAMDEMSYGGDTSGANGAADDDTTQRALSALAIYGVLDNPSWLDHLGRGYLDASEQSAVQRTAHETLISLADYGVRWRQWRTEATARASLKYLELAATIRPPTRAFYWVRSECHGILGNDTLAAQDLERLAATPAETAFDYFLPGHTAGWNGKHDEAVNSYRAALRIQPNHFNSLFFLALRITQWEDRLGEADALYRSCLLLRPDHVPSLRNRALILHDRGQLEEALEMSNKAVLLSEAPSTKVSSLSVRSLLLIRLGKRGQALSDIRHAAEVADRHLEDFVEGTSVLNDFAWELVASPEQSFWDPPLAVRLATRAVELAPDAMHWNTLGVAFYRNGDWERAVLSLHTSASLLTSLSAHNGFFLGMSLWKLGHHEAARDWYTASVVQIGEAPRGELLRFRTESEELMGLTEEDRKDLVEQFDAERELEIPAPALTDDLLQSVRSSVRRAPEDVAMWNAWSRAARAYYHTKNWLGANSEARLAIDIAPNRPIHLLRVAPLLLLAGEEETYRQLCQRLMSRSQKLSVEERRDLVALYALDPQAWSEPEKVLRLAQAVAEARAPWIEEFVPRANYRAGDFASAIRVLEALDDAWHKPVDLAIAHALAGNPAEAKVWLEKARKEAEDPSRLASAPNELMQTILIREAEQLIETDE